MKFPTLKNSAKNFERTVRLDGGINSVLSPMLMSENEMSDCSNVIFKDSMLSSRKGFFTDNDMILGTVNSTYKLKTPFKFLDGVFVFDGKECRIGYAIIWDERSFALFYSYLVFSDGTYKEINTMRFGISGSNFFAPETLCVFKGKGTSGGGIYLFCQTKNYTSTEPIYDYGIFELNFEPNYWNRIDESQCYAPIVYYHGRGNRFFESSAKDDAIYEKPSELEPQNLLSGYFNCYFSTDGCSDSFQLPITDLGDRTIVCILSYKDGSVYRWIISGTESEITFLNTKVRATINRKTGLISFTQNSTPYALPVLVNGSVNNLKITAYKSNNDGIASIVGSTGVVNHKSNIISYGSHIAPNKIFTASSENPLYFPKDCSCEVGTSGENVTAMKKIEDSLIAFTADSVYSIKLSEGDLIAYCELISGESKSFFKPDKLTCSALNSQFGCRLPKSIMTIGDKCVFQGRYKIYIMSKAGKVYSISYPVSAMAEEGSIGKNQAISFVYDGFYGIVIDDKIYLADIENFDTKSTKANWYVWQLPNNSTITDAAHIGKNPLFAFLNSQEDVYYLSKLFGDKDITLTGDSSAFSTSESVITAYFKTAFIDFDKIKLEAIRLKIGSNGDLLIEVDGDGTICKFNIDVNLTPQDYESGIIKKVTVYPSLKTDKASIKVIGDNPFYISELKFFYR